MLRRTSRIESKRAKIQRAANTGRTTFEALEFRRLLSAATPDPTFGDNGVVTTDFGGIEGAIATAIQGDGKIIAVGTDFAIDQGVMARYNDDGSLDTGFGAGGKVLLGTHSFAEAAGVAISNGSIYVAGNTLPGGGDLVVGRFTSSGAIDASYGDAGIALGGVMGTASGLVLRGDSAVVAGTVHGPSSLDFAVLQFTPGGMLDENFGTLGRKLWDFGASANDQANAIAMQPDGSVVVVGFTHGTDASQNFALARLNTSGGIDTSFGSGGLVNENFGGTSDLLSAVSIASDGSIYVGGRYMDNSGNTGAVARYSAAGVIDAGFGGSSNGIVRLPGTFAVTGIGSDSAGNVLAVADNSAFGASLWRFQADGNLDMGFGAGGSVETPLFLSGGVTIQSDDKAIVFGSDGEDFMLVRYGEGDDGGGGGDVFTVAYDSASGNLNITGTTGDDSVVVTRNTSGVFVESGGVTYGPFSPTGWIVINLGDGDDQVNVSSSLTVPMYINGGAGNDTIKGGGGHDILIGGDGDDRIMGSAGRDIIIGGAGADRLLGHQDDDILIAGFTSYDAPTPTNIAALQDIMDEWTSNNPYADRIYKIRNGGGANGTSVFNSSTVFNDGAIDTLSGHAGSDWFIFDEDFDVVSDLHKGEFGDDIP